MKTYLVGGAVRDRLLGISDSNTEKDWVVVGSSPDEMMDLGYRQVGKEFPVFLDPDKQEEYALARLERKVGKGYKGFEFDTSSEVTLEQDLSRRDLTINAIAEDEDNGILIDPFNGQQDLDDGLLKHVSSAFSEDPVRVLRVARFAARFKVFGFKVAHETHKLMSQMVSSGEVDALTPERIFKELNKSLSYNTPSAFFKVLSACGAYERVFSSVKLDEHQNHNNQFEFLDNLDTDKAYVKFAIWLKDESDENITKLCNSIKCPKQYEQLASLSSKYYGFVAQKSYDTNSVITFLSGTDALRRQDRFEDLLEVFKLLGLNIGWIVELKSILKSIDASKLDKTNIAKSIQDEKVRIVDKFLSSKKIAK